LLRRTGERLTIPRARLGTLVVAHARSIPGTGITRWRSRRPRRRWDSRCSGVGQGSIGDAEIVGFA
jgi:hypothetical protein